MTPSGESAFRPERVSRPREQVESQIRAAMAAGAERFDGAIDADLPEHEERITKWARLVLPRLAG
jgi:hypothetical protein